MGSEYSADQIQILEGLEAVRKRTFRKLISPQILAALAQL
mgnify:CR=1 FL=1